MHPQAPTELRRRAVPAHEAKFLELVLLPLQVLLSGPRLARGFLCLLLLLLL
jgi:hypothetical protein